MPWDDGFAARPEGSSRAHREPCKVAGWAWHRKNPYSNSSYLFSWSNTKWYLRIPFWHLHSREPRLVSLPSALQQS